MKIDKERRRSGPKRDLIPTNMSNTTSQNHTSSIPLSIPQCHILHHLSVTIVYIFASISLDICMKGVPHGQGLDYD